MRSSNADADIGEGALSNVRAALFDVDGTLTSGGSVWRPLLRSPDVSPAKKAWLYATAMPHYLLSKGRMASQAGFRDRWVRLMAWLMAGWSVEAVEEICQEVASTQLAPNLRLDVVDILKQHQQHGHYVVLVSTMFEGIVQEIARLLGADVGLGSRVAVQDGRCLGRVEDMTCSGERKVQFVREHLAQRPERISLAECAAYADSRADFPLLASVGYPVAVYPDSAMRAYAEKRGWRVFGGM